MPRTPGLGSLGRISGLGGNAAAPARTVPKVAATTGVPARPPRDLDKPAVFPRGPAILGLGDERIKTGGPGLAPEAFRGPTVSAYEWVFYWASANVFKDPKDPRQPPYDGARDGSWEYQAPTLPGEPRASGESISDFLYHLPTGDLIVRLDTWYRHVTAGPDVQARDDYTRLHAGGPGTRVEVVYDNQYVHDPTGYAAIQALLAVIAGEGIISPIRGGTAFAVIDAIVRPVPVL